MVKKVLFYCQFVKIGILTDLHILRSPESENHIFLAISMCVFIDGWM